MSNFSRHPNAVPVAALSRWLIAAVFLGAAGLSYVYFKNQLHVSGDEIRGLERQLSELRVQNDVVRAQISSLTSRGYVQKKLHEGYLHMVQIADKDIVRIAVKTSSPAHDELRQIANRESKK